MKRFTIHHISGMKECWTMWGGKSEEEAEEEFLLEHPDAEILDIEEVNETKLH